MTNRKLQFRFHGRSYTITHIFEHDNGKVFPGTLINEDSLTPIKLVFFDKDQITRVNTWDEYSKEPVKYQPKKHFETLIKHQPWLVEEYKKLIHE